MFVDFTLKITPELIIDAQGNEKKSLVGHLGTHFDVMNKEFPLEYLRLPSVIFNVHNKQEIQFNDIDFSQIKEGMFVGFATVAIIGIDCAGIRRGKEHTPIDQYCADHNVFVIENLCNLQTFLHSKDHMTCYINTYPVHYSDMTGLPCRVVAEV